MDREQPAGAISCNGAALLAAAAKDNATIGHSFDKEAWQAVATAAKTSCPANSTCMATAYSNTNLGCCAYSGEFMPSKSLKLPCFGGH